MQRLKRALSDHFVQIDYTDNLVVLKCLPGTANTISALLDSLEWSEIVGTISGDDTILVICRTKEQSGSFVDQIMSLLS
jgi:transcriptional regulator of arginine metabolism